MIDDTNSAEVTRTNFLTMQVCVPKAWSDEQVKEFADTNNPAGTSGGWFVCKAENEVLGGDGERVLCATKPDFVHVVLEC